MKAKQVLAIIVTAVVIITTGVMGVATNVFNEKYLGVKKTTDSLFASGWTEEIMLPEEAFIGQINIEGEIGPSSEDIWSTGTGVYDHDLNMQYIDQMMYSDNNKGIMLFINTPGGTVYESDELYLKLMEYKEVTGRPVWAYFGAEACSGGYYIAMAADYIVANRNCWTGSIGVAISIINCKDLYEKIGIKEIDITSGANKAMGAAGLDLTEEQYAILQSLVDEAYDQFVDIVCKGRKMDEETVRKLADGRIYSANQALELKLIDEVGTYEEEQIAFVEEYELPDDILYYSPESAETDLFSGIFATLQDLKPQSELELATDIMENSGNGVLKYYAK